MSISENSGATILHIRPHWHILVTVMIVCPCLHPLSPTPADFHIFKFCDFPINVDLENEPVGCGTSKLIGTGCGLQMDGFSGHFEPYERIFRDFYVFDYFAFVSEGLMLFPEGPRTFRECSEGPGTPGRSQQPCS